MQQAIRFYGFPLNCLLHMQLRPAFKWGHDVLYKSICKTSQTQSTATYNMPAFVTVVDVIPVQIYAMGPAFLVRPKVTFWYRFRISLWISGTTWKLCPSSCDLILRNKKKWKEDNSVPIFIRIACGEMTWMRIIFNRGFPHVSNEKPTVCFLPMALSFERLIHLWCSFA